jgi:DNA-binding NtrC family response regulator
MNMTQTVLVVEDEAIIRMAVVATLEDAGFAVLEAQNSAEALAQLAQHAEIDVLLTDVRMPGRMDGLALVAQAQRDYPAIPAIVMSGNATAAEACHAGACGFVHKPYMPRVIVQMVHDAARQLADIANPHLNSLDNLANALPGR